jgi:ABC-type amino acid transport system permease subunit
MASRVKPPLSPAREAWRRFRRHRLAVISIAVLLLLVIGIAIGPLLWRTPIDDIDFGAQLAGPSWTHPFGTDDLGQDLLARMIHGGRVSLAVGVAAMLVAVIVGVVIGAIAGMASGWVDALLMWASDLFLSLPQLPLLLLIIYLFRDTLRRLLGTEGGVFVLIVVVIGGLRWMPVARLVRAQFFSLREKEFVEAARAPGGAAHPAQCHGSGDRRCHHRGRQRDHRGIDVVLPRPRLSARCADLGPHAVRCAGLPGHRTTLGAVPWCCDLSRRAVHQLHRRRPARRARFTTGDLGERRHRQQCRHPRHPRPAHMVPHR